MRLALPVLISLPLRNLLNQPVYSLRQGDRAPPAKFEWNQFGPKTSLTIFRQVSL